MHQLICCAALALSLSPLLWSLGQNAHGLGASEAPFADQEGRSSEAGALRRDLLIDARAAVDIDATVAWATRVWGIGGGDPHKYLFPDLLARLHRDSTDEAAWNAYRHLMAVDKAKAGGDRGLYHFAVPGLARLYFGFADALPDDVREWIRYNAGGHLHHFRAGGTENHQTQSRVSGYLFAERFQAPDASQDHLGFLRNWMIQEVRKLYTIGMGEWDSSSYVTFTVGSWLNVYEYAADPLMRDWARAALDWYAAAYGLKYFHGILAGPESRGFSRNAQRRSNSDMMAWLWWGNLLPAAAAEPIPAGNAPRYAILPALSPYQPHPIIGRLARKELELPFVSRASKPAYFGYEEHNVQHEYLYVDRDMVMGSLACPHPGDRVVGTIWPQTAMFKLAVRDQDDVHVFGAANGFHRHFPVEGRTPFDQYHQARGAMINIAHIPEYDENSRAMPQSFLAVPAAATVTGSAENWVFMRLGAVRIAARGLGATPEWTDLREWTRRTSNDPSQEPERVREYPDLRWLESRGSLTGWIIDTARVSDHPNDEAFQAAILEADRLNLDAFASEHRLSYRSLAGDTMVMRHTGGPGGRPEAMTNGEAIHFADWPVYESPYLNQALGSGILEINDGQRLLRIDVSGERPRWEELDLP